MNLGRTTSSIVLLAVFLSGCSTLGELEPMNDAGLGDAREAISTYNKTLNVLGVTSRTNNAAVINRGYGHLQNMNTNPTDINDIPFTVRDINEIMRYLK